MHRGEGARVSLVTPWFGIKDRVNCCDEGSRSCACVTWMDNINNILSNACWTPFLVRSCTTQCAVQSGTLCVQMFLFLPKLCISASCYNAPNTHLWGCESLLLKSLDSDHVKCIWVWLFICRSFFNLLTGIDPATLVWHERVCMRGLVNLNGKYWL